MPESRAERRKQRYDELRRLGFSSAEATRLRDRSGGEIRRRIPLRTREAYPRSIRNDTTVYSEDDRHEFFREWTGNRSFPDWALEAIHQFNREVNRLDSDSYGFRRFFYLYVRDRKPTAAARLANRDDS